MSAYLEFDPKNELESWLTQYGREIVFQRDSLPKPNEQAAGSCGLAFVCCMPDYHQATAILEDVGHAYEFLADKRRRRFFLVPWEDVLRDCTISSKDSLRGKYPSWIPQEDA